MYSTHKEGTSVIVEKFIRTLKNKFIIPNINIKKICVLAN